MLEIEHGCNEDGLKGFFVDLKGLLGKHDMCICGFGTQMGYGDDVLSFETNRNNKKNLTDMSITKDHKKESYIGLLNISGRGLNKSNIDEVIDSL